MSDVTHTSQYAPHGAHSSSEVISPYSSCSIRSPPLLFILFKLSPGLSPTRYYHIWFDLHLGAGEQQAVSDNAHWQDPLGAGGRPLYEYYHHLQLEVGRLYLIQRLSCLLGDYDTVTTIGCIDTPMALKTTVHMAGTTTTLTTITTTMVA